MAPPSPWAAIARLPAVQRRRSKLDSGCSLRGRCGSLCMCVGTIARWTRLRCECVLRGSLPPNSIMTAFGFKVPPTPASQGEVMVHMYFVVTPRCLGAAVLAFNGRRQFLRQLSFEQIPCTTEEQNNEQHAKYCGEV